MAGSSPNWVSGYTPTAGEWNAEWASKMDATLFSTLASAPSYADDTEAAAGGVAIGSPYRNGNFIMVRLS